MALITLVYIEFECPKYLSYGSLLVYKGLIG